MSDKHCEADLENPLLKPRYECRWSGAAAAASTDDDDREAAVRRIEEEAAVHRIEEDRCSFFVLIGLILFVTMSLVFILIVPAPRSAVFVSSLNASSNGTTWDTTLSLRYPVFYFQALNATYDARASLRLRSNASAAAAAAAMHYSRDEVFLHALFDIKDEEGEEEDGVVEVDVTVEANATLVYGREMGSYMTIGCSGLKMELERGVGRLLDSGESCRIRTYRDGEWSEGVGRQMLVEYVVSVYRGLHPTWESVVRDPFNSWVRRLHREASAAFTDADAWIDSPYDFPFFVPTFHYSAAYLH